MKTQRKILSLILAICLVAGLLPTTVFAAGTGKAIQIVNASNPTGGIEGYNNGYDYIYMGSYNSSPVKWRVLDDQTNTGATGLFLLSEDLLGSGKYGDVYFDITRRKNNVWQGSSAQAWCNTFESSSLDSRELVAILSTTKSDGAHSSFAASNNILNGDQVFFLSAQEAANAKYGFANNTARVAKYGGSAFRWWLRSPFASDALYAGYILHSGHVGRDSVPMFMAARPAFNLNLNSVLFTSAAAGGKPDGGLKAVSDYTGSEWKLTLKDSSRSSFAISNISAVRTSTKVISVTADYSGAQTGSNEYISAMIRNGDTVKYYGRLKAVGDSASGTVEIALPAMASGDKLYIFNEQYNGDKKTDYASELKEVTIPTEVTAYDVSYTLTGLSTNGASYVKQGENYTAKLTANSGYDLPESISMTMSGAAFTDFSYDKSNGAVSIAADKITDDLVITAKGVLKAPTITTGNASLTYNGSDQAVSVEATHELKDTYPISYAVYQKDGTSPISTTNEFKVKNVADSGTFKIVATISDGNQTKTAEKEIAVSIAKATPTVAAPSASGITYGQTLASSTLTAGWTWADDTTVPTVTNSGYTAYYAIADEINYDWLGIEGYDSANSRLARTVAVAVGKATPTYTAPTGLTATYGDQLSSVTLPPEWAWADGTQLVGDAGTNTFKATYTPSDTNYSAVADIDVKVAVSPKQITAPAEDATPYTYNGQVQTYNLATDERYTISNNTRIDVGSQVVTVALNDPSNYEWTTGGTEDKTYTFTIGQKDIAGAEITLGAALTYSSFEQTQEVASVEIDGLSVTYSLSGNTATNAGNYTLTVEGTGNFSGTATKVWTLNKAPHSAIDKSVEIHNGEIRTGTIELANIYGNMAIPDGAKILSVSPPQTVNIMDSVANTETTISYTSKDNAQGTTATDVYAVMIETTNYATYELDLTFVATDKTHTDIIVTEVNENIYNGQPQKGYTGEPTSDFTGTYTYHYKGTTIENEPYDEATPPTEVGHYNVTIKVPVDDPIYIGEISFPMNIKKATVEVAAIDRSIYVGAAAPASELVEGTHYSISGTVEGQPLEGSLTAKYLDKDGKEADPASLAIGSYTIVLTGLSAPGATAHNYDPITFTNGTLTVRSRPVSTYRITVEDTDNGAITSSRSYASYHTTVTLTATPEDGYELNDLTVTDGRDNMIELTDLGDGKYRFKMPARTVTVSATFAKVKQETPTDEPCDGGTNCPSAHFTDVDWSQWYHEAMDYVVENGLMQGTAATLFSPNLTTSRGMIVTILWRLEGEPNVAISETLLDVPESQYYYQAVKWAIANDILEGYGEGYYGPDDPITREQLATILWRYAKYKGIDVRIGEDTNILSYNDAFEISDWAMDAMQWACGEGIIQGKPDYLLDPQGDAKRCEAAAMLMRFLTNEE